jgi:hypothetical protein
MPRKQRLTWTVVFWLAVVITGFASLAVSVGEPRCGSSRVSAPTARSALGMTRCGGGAGPTQSSLRTPPVTKAPLAARLSAVEAQGRARRGST